MIKDFEYIRPSNVKEALALLTKYRDESKVICGGQSLLILMRQGLVTTEYLVDIKHLKELKYIHFDSEKGLKIGAVTTHREIETSGLVKERFGVLADMEKKLASIQTRNWGTIGGNLCHGDPSSDPAVVLIALKAVLKIGNTDSGRRMEIENFFIDYFETALNKDELLLEIQVPVPPPRTATAFDKFTIIENDMGIVSVAVSITLDGGGATCKDARIAFGNVGSTPKRAIESEKILVGKKLNNKLLQQVGQIAQEEAEPISDIHASEEYRRHIMKVFTERMVEKAWEQARMLI